MSEVRPKVLVIAPNAEVRVAVGTFLSEVMDLDHQAAESLAWSNGLLAAQKFEFALFDITHPKQIADIKNLTDRGIPVQVLADRPTSLLLEAHEVPHISRPYNLTIKNIVSGVLPLHVLAPLAPSIENVIRDPQAKLAEMKVAFDRQSDRPSEMMGLVHDVKRSIVDNAGQKTILVVEDDPDVADVTSMMLEIRDYQPIVVGNGDDAIKALEANPNISLALIDLNIPFAEKGRSGIDVAEAAVKSDVPSFFVTGLDRDGQFQAAGVPFIQKPYKAEQLLNKVAAFITSPDDNCSRMELGLTRLGMARETPHPTYQNGRLVPEIVRPATAQPGQAYSSNSQIGVEALVLRR